MLKLLLWLLLFFLCWPLALLALVTLLAKSIVEWKSRQQTKQQELFAARQTITPTLTTSAGAKAA